MAMRITTMRTTITMAMVIMVTATAMRRLISAGPSRSAPA